jgi:hypothetical protein
MWGCPDVVYGSFQISELCINRLDYMPKYVGGSISLFMETLMVLENIPKTIYKSLYVSSKKMTNLVGSPLYAKTIHLECPNLESLLGFEKSTTNDLIIKNTRIKTLEGINFHSEHRMDIRIEQNYLVSITKEIDDYVLGMSPESLEFKPNRQSGSVVIKCNNINVVMTPEDIVSYVRAIKLNHFT